MNDLMEVCFARALVRASGESCESRAQEECRKSIDPLFAASMASLAGKTCWATAYDKVVAIAMVATEISYVNCMQLHSYLRCKYISS